MLSSAFREKLPSAGAAIAVQLGLFALLALSFTMVSRAPVEKETILILPPLPRVVPRPQPMVIDARGARKAVPLMVPAPPPEEIVPQTPTVAAPAAPSGTAIAPALPAIAQADCSPDARARMLPARRAAVCPPLPTGPNDVPLQIGEGHVKDEEYFAAEKARRDAPPSLPGAAGGPLGILLTALFNPSAFADKRNYSYGPAGPPRGGATPPSQPLPRHATDDEFQKALKAVNDKKRGLPAKPVTPEPPGGTER